MKERFEAWLTAWLGLFANLVVIISYCHWQPTWDFLLMIRHNKRDLKKEIKERK